MEGVPKTLLLLFAGYHDSGTIASFGDGVNSVALVAVPLLEGSTFPTGTCISPSPNVK